MATGIIEIIGPPGVGKTTIYDALCKSWHSQSNWTYWEALLTPPPKFWKVKKWLAYRLRSLLRKKPVRNIPLEAGLKFATGRQQLATFYWNLLSDPRIYDENAINKRFRAAFFLFQDFCRYQAILEVKSEKPCLINEGLLQKAFLVHEDRNLMQELVDTCLPLVPLPQAVIYINTNDKNIICERLLNRKKVIASHLGKESNALLDDIANWQFLLDALTERLANWNIPVCRINGEKPVSENVAIINRFIGIRHNPASDITSTKFDQVYQVKM